MILYPREMRIRAELPVRTASDVPWAELPDALWAGLAARHAFETRSWLEAVDPQGTVAHLVPVRDRTVALGLCGPADEHLAQAPTPAPLHTGADILCGPRALALLAALGLDLADPPPWTSVRGLLTVLSPLAYRSCAPGLRAGDGPVVLAELQRLVRQRGATGVLLPFLRAGEIELFGGDHTATSHAAVVSVVGAGCRLHTDRPLHRRRTDSRSFRRAHDRYLGRRAAGEVHEAVLGPGEPLPQHLLDDVLDLLVCDATSHGIAAPPRRLHRAILSAWPATRTVQWTTRKGSREVTGVEIGIVEGRELVAKLGGHRDRDRGYLDVGLTGTIDLGYRLGVDSIDLGPSTHAPKLERGCEVYWVFACLVAADRAVLPELTRWMARYESVFVPHMQRIARQHGHTAVPPTVPSNVGEVQ